jgi:hypothetical protein
MTWGEYTPEGKALMLWALREVMSHMSLHSGVPTAENELPTGIYRRRQIDMREPVDGAMRSERKVVFDVPEGVRVAYAAFWDRPIGGVMLARAELSKSESFVGAGVYEVDVAEMDLNLDIAQE